VEQNLKFSDSTETPEILEAIDDLAAKLSELEPGLDRQEAAEKIRKTVHDLLRDAGTVA
jgi:hypothetical protein